MKKNDITIYGHNTPKNCKRCPMKSKEYRYLPENSYYPECVYCCVWTKDIVDLKSKLRPQNCPTRKPIKKQEYSEDGR